jgi:GTP cyclohydrolase II
MNIVSANATPVAKVTSALAPSRREIVMRARSDMRMGTPLVLTDGRHAVLVAGVEMLHPERHAALAALSSTCQLAVSRQRLEALGITGPEGTDTVCLTLPARTSLPVLRAIADPALSQGNINFDIAQGVEAGTALHKAAIALAKAAQILPAALVVSVADGPMQATRHGLSLTDARDVLQELGAASVQQPVATAFLPMAVSQAGRVHVFRPDDGGIEHYAIEIGTPDLSGPVLVRLHSACFTGDVLGSLKCDCGPQLHAACASMAAAGGGVLLYLNQEGRGIGMANKMRAYALQHTGLDTVEANHALGFHDDERDFRIGATLLRQMGITAVRLMTNNPAKVAVLHQHGMDVVGRVPLQVGQTPQNAGYLATKARKSGHLLP